MTRRRFLGTSALAAAMLSKADAALRQGNLDQAAALIQKTVDEGKLEAATLSVVQGSHRFEKAFGKAKSVDSILLIASISKPMTAAGVMVLADRGELKLSDPASKYLPEFSEGDRKRITIQQLLTHTSGLPDQLPENAELRKSHQPLSEFVAHAVKTPLLFKPGTQYKYQSMGILLAAEIAQRITGQSTLEFLDKEVFQPLGMTRTAMGLGRIKIEDTMRSQVEYSAPEAGAGSPDTLDWDWNSPYWRNLGAPWGGAHSTAPDITRFLRSFLHPDGKVLKPETARAMIQDHNQGLDTPRGIGFQLAPAFGEHCSSKTFGHGGSTGTKSWADPVTDTSFVLLTTLPSSASDKILLDPVSELVAQAD